ncbi:hypothetical protein PVAG01_10006 [Phlyctema vagabunda]|uniref:RRM domain-containing protein n=1 Tax=Phlyctema vagabunda TaxID=108571 RepID=A0ABR4P4R0_9HELO
MYDSKIPGLFMSTRCDANASPLRETRASRINARHNSQVADYSIDKPGPLKIDDSTMSIKKETRRLIEPNLLKIVELLPPREPTGSVNDTGNSTFNGSPTQAQQDQGSSITRNNMFAEPITRGRRDSVGRAFHPTRRIREKGQPAAERTRERSDTKSRNYQGQITNWDLRNAQVAECQNCSLYLTNIHPSVQDNLVKLACLIKTGKVYTIHLNPPIHERKISTCAAFVSFKTRCGAERFLHACRAPPGISIHGQALEARWNREKVAPALKPEQSRVVVFMGPRDQISLESLEREFKEYLYYTLITSTSLDTDNGERIIAMEFASIRAQAESAFMCFQALHGKDAGYSVSWGVDPCGLNQDQGCWRVMD